MADAIIAGPIARKIEEEHAIARHIWKTKADAAERDLDEAVKLLARAVFNYMTISAQDMSHSLLNRVKEAQESR